MTSFADKFNGNVCNSIVVDVESMTEWFNGEIPDSFIFAYDPSMTFVVLGEYYLDDEGEAVVAELEVGDVQGAARCRALYDLNEVSGGFCCQTFGLEYGGEIQQHNELTEAMGVYAQEGEITIDYYGEEAPVYWAAERFASANGMAASFITMTAALMAFT